MRNNVGRGTRPTVHKNGRVCPICYTLRAGRAYGPQGQRLQGLGNLGPFLFAPIAGPQRQNHGHRAKAWQGIRARPWAYRPKLGVPSFILTFGCHPIAGPGHRAKGHRPKAGRPKLGVLFSYLAFGDCLGKLSFLGRSVCGGTLSPLTSRPVKFSARPNYRPKKKTPFGVSLFASLGLS